MSIYSRSYMQHDRSAYNRSEWAIKAVVIALTVVFLLQNVFRHWLGSYFLEQHFSLDLVQLSRGWIHTLLSYGLLHSTAQALPWHLLVNCLMLYWFGRELESRFGSGRFLELFIFCIFSGGLTWTMVHFATGQNSGVVGASAGVFGVLYLFCRQRWQTSMSFLFIPIQFTGQQLLWVLLGFQVFFLLFAELPGTAGSATAYSAHLGGMMGAFIYENNLARFPTLAQVIRRLFAGKATVEKPRWSKRVEAARASTGNRFKINTRDRPAMKKEVDRILDKINSSGFGALTEEEKQLLDKAKDLL